MAQGDGFSSVRRRLLATALALPWFAAHATPRVKEERHAAAIEQLQALEASFAGRLGVAVIDTADNAQLHHRAQERFPLCSTFKVMAAAAVLARHGQDAGLLQERLHFSRQELVAYSPVTALHVEEGMTLAELCAAALRYSDNTAGNLLIRRVGGVEAVTAFARSTGDTQFRLDRWETELNSAIPGDPRDTTTPQAMAASLQRLVLGDALGAGREQLRQWLLGNTTGAGRIRAGLPADWQIGDKTGTGDYGSANDIAVAWPPGRPPVVLAIYTHCRQKDARARSDIIAGAAAIAAKWLG